MQDKKLYKIFVRIVVERVHKRTSNRKFCLQGCVLLTTRAGLFKVGLNLTPAKQKLQQLLLLEGKDYRSYKILLESSEKNS